MRNKKIDIYLYIFIYKLFFFKPKENIFSNYVYVLLKIYYF
jgi:hypothetical protein